MGDKTELAVAILNGAVGDHLAGTGNGLATELTLVAGGGPVAPERDALARAFPGASARVVLLVHGMMTTEAIWKVPVLAAPARAVHLAHDAAVATTYSLVRLVGRALGAMAATRRP